MVSEPYLFRTRMTAHPPQPRPEREPLVWRCSHARRIVLDRPRIIAILNLTPDSFHTGARFTDPGAAVAHAEHAVAHGADMLELGAESTRPGSAPVAPDEQLARLLPVLARLRAPRGPMTGIPLSIDTSSAAVAGAALDAGADVINDVSAGRDDPAMLPLVASRGAGIVLMHRLRPPSADSYSDRYADAPAYRDLVEDVRGFLEARTGAAVGAGIDPGAIVIDPGLGFGKTVEQNLALLRATPRLAALGHPVLSALSRKSFVGRVSLGRDSTPEERLEGTLALSVAHLHSGTRLFRVHDVREHAAALRAAWAVLGNGGTPGGAPGERPAGT